MDVPRSTLATTSSTSFLWSERVSDQSMRSALQPYLERFDQNSNRESWGSSVDLIVNSPLDLSLFPEPLPFYGSDLEFGPLDSVGVASALQESLDLVAHDVQSDILPCSTSSDDPAAEDFLPQRGTGPDEQTLSSSSITGRFDEQSLLAVVQGIREKVKCTWPGCLRSVQKENLTRHVNEMHRRKIKAVCNQCGNGFTRPYMMRDHKCRAKRRNF